MEDVGAATFSHAHGVTTGMDVSAFLSDAMKSDPSVVNVGSFGDSSGGFVHYIWHGPAARYVYKIAFPCYDGGEKIITSVPQHKASLILVDLTNPRALDDWCVVNSEFKVDSIFTVGSPM